MRAISVWWADVNRRLDQWLATRGGHVTFDPPPVHPMCPCVDYADPWATNEWQRTLVTPVFVGGPADGARDEPRPRYELVERISMPTVALGEVVWEDLEDPHVEQRFAFDVYVYRLGPYVDAFTVEYR